MHDVREMGNQFVQPLPNACRQKMHSEGGMSARRLPRRKQDIKKMIIKQRSMDNGIHKSEDNEGVDGRAQSEILKINVVQIINTDNIIKRLSGF